GGGRCRAGASHAVAVWRTTRAGQSGGSRCAPGETGCAAARAEVGGATPRAWTGQSAGTASATPPKATVRVASVAPTVEVVVDGPAEVVVVPGSARIDVPWSPHAPSASAAITGIDRVKVRVRDRMGGTDGSVAPR